MPDNPIDKAKQKAIDPLLKQIGGIEDAVIGIFNQAIEDNFNIEDGKIKQTKAFIKQLNNMTADVLKAMQADTKFTGAVGQFVKRLDGISTAIEDFQASTNGINVPDFTTAKQVAINEIVDQFLNNGINQNFIQPLRDLIYQNATSGLSLKDAKQQIKDYIKGGKDVSGKLGSYIEQTAQQAVDSYSGLINKKLVEQFNYDALLMTGSLIDTSSPQCKFVVKELNRRITRQNWPKVEAIAKNNGLVKGTTFDNLPLNLNHWGCRHGFYPIMLKTA